MRIPEEVLEDVEEEAEKADESRSEYLRDVIDSRNEHAEEADALREELNELRTEVDRLRNEKRALIDDREERQDLVEYVEHEKSLQEERLEASAIERAKWWVFGKKSEN